MKIVKLDNQGRGITYQVGKIIFVENALENEEVTINITQDKKNYAFGVAIEIKEENKNRVIPKCPYYQKCGGCNLMHINCAYEEEYKVTKVGEILKKYANIDADIRLIKNDRELFYRNKITLKIENNKFGYYNANTHKFIEVESCLIAASSINKIINNHDFLEIKNGEIVIRSNYQDDILISINTDEEYLLKDNIPSNIKGIVINDKTIYKNNYFYDYIGELKFKISYNAFFQVNNYMAKQIFDILNNHLSGKNLLDLYCGVGTLGLSLKDKYKNIYGIEKIGNAIKDARYNAHNNAIENAHYYTGDTSKILKKINTKFDTVIVYPPRSGLNKETIDQLIKIKPQQLAYISCNPLTLARDLKILKEFFSIEKLNALDMFPNTHHVECICILNRR